MALSSLVEFAVAGFPAQEKLVIARVTLDANYPAGGYVLTPALFNLSAFAARGDGTALINPKVLSFSGGGGSPVMCDVDQTTGTLRVYYPTGGGNAAPGALAAPAGTVPVGATGVTSTAAQPGIALTPGQAKEVAAATSLAGIVVDLLAIGH